MKKLNKKELTEIVGGPTLVEFALETAILFIVVVAIFGSPNPNPEASIEHVLDGIQNGVEA